jgi:DNA-binding transcriptional LysR family regulator
MDRLEAMSVLLEAVDAGSLSAAGRRLGVPLATVSRKVSDLEKHLNCRLLIRGGRKLLLTEAGHSYVVACRQILDDIKEAELRASGEYRAPQGELVISVPIVFGRTHVLPILADFLQAYPDVQVRMQQTDRAVSLLEEHVDLAVRLGELPDSSLIAIRVGHIGQVLCASPAYLDKHGVPRQPDDLKNHDCVAFGALTPGGTRWLFSKDGSEVVADIQPRLFVNTAEAAATAATEGIGIARVLSYQVEDLVAAGALTIVLADYEPARIPISLVYPSQRQVPLKLRAFLDFASPRLRESLGYKPW